jgi:hypothetical protein
MKKIKNFAFNRPAFTEVALLCVLLVLGTDANAYSTIVIDLFLEK